jgi:hypothetical protein
MEARFLSAPLVVMPKEIRLFSSPAFARVVYSEDLANGQRYGAARVVNPFVER